MYIINNIVFETNRYFICLTTMSRCLIQERHALCGPSPGRPSEERPDVGNCAAWSSAGDCLNAADSFSLIRNSLLNVIVVQ